MRFAALILALAACGALAIAAIQTPHDGLIGFAVLALVGLGTYWLADGLARRRSALGSLRRQLVIAVAIAAGVVLLTVTIFAELMLVDQRAALVVCLVTVFAAAIAILAGRHMLEGISSDVELMRDGLADVGAGRRDVEIVTGGHDELAQLAAEANSMIERLASEESARRSLVAAVSHDLRTPLTSLTLLASAVEDDVVSPADRNSYLASMRVHIDALSALIDDLFELSRLEAGDVVWKKQRLSLGDLVTETVDAMRPQANARGVAVSVTDCRALPAVNVDPEKMQRVLFNLLQNAIQNTPRSGSVVVTAERQGQGIEVEVSDTGRGVAERDRDRMFDAFVRGSDNEARSGDGAGLGLAISRAIVESHGGRIWFADAASGTRVRFSLPRV